ncbi:DUF885 domain-containing protein [Streptomyces sp. NPDC058665]|uniref:DUF885 domain-containing protein n=1 Tax=Streptomyces sp. NPDC058665 TaxID=3346586 RepID=UPI00365E11CE
MAEPAERVPTAIDALAEEWLGTLLRLEPELRVTLGRPDPDPGFNDRSPAGADETADAARSLLVRLRAAAPADAVDTVTRADLIDTLEVTAEQHEAGFWQRDLKVVASPVQRMRKVFDLMPTGTDEDWHRVARRLHRLPEAMAGYRRSLQAGIAARNTPALRQVRDVAAQTTQLGAAGGYFTRLTSPARGSVPPALWSDLASGARSAAGAYADLAAFLVRDLAPHAPRHDGVGREHYKIAARGFFGAGTDLDDAYAWGCEELARTVAEQERTAREIKPGASVEEVAALLDADPARRLIGTDALRAWMQEVSDRTVEELAGTHFDIPWPMRRLECRIAPTSGGGIYYTPPSLDFTRPGRMWWSVPEGDTVFFPWRELTTVHHEGVPGHHLQCAAAIHHRDRLKAWRRVSWNVGHGEGWALYAERLMAELGYLDDPADWLGMLDAQRLRAARVVIDLGVHLGKPKPDGTGTWTGADAFAFLAEHVTMSDAFVRLEATRYLGWPAQAASYKIGQRLWESLRDDYTAAGRGDPRTFHREALALGPVRWIFAGPERLARHLAALPKCPQETTLRALRRLAMHRTRRPGLIHEDPPDRP